MEKDYLSKIQSMSDDELKVEHQHVIDMLSDGYERLKGRDLLVEASIKLCEDAIEAIKIEFNRRKNR